MSKIITIRCSVKLKDWLDNECGYNRTQASIVSESIVLYKTIYLYLKPYLSSIVSTDYSCTIRPVMNVQQYNSIVELFDKNDSKVINSHIRSAIYTYYYLYPKLKVYNLYEVDKEDGEALLNLLYELEIVVRNSGEFKWCFR